jgi:hypothetical protein
VLSDSSQPDIVPLTIAASDQNQSEAALAWLTSVAGAFTKELRRVLPFLARQRARLAIDQARTADDAELRAPAEGPCFLVRMSSPEQVWLALQFDTLAIAALLDGLFVTPKPESEEQEDGEGDAADAAPSSIGDSLTLAQRALLKRLCGDLSALVKQPVADVCKAKLGAPEFAIFKRGELPELTEDAIGIDCKVENVRRPWAIRIWMGAEALQQLAAKESEQSSAAPSLGPRPCASLSPWWPSWAVSH